MRSCSDCSLRAHKVWICLLRDSKPRQRFSITCNS